jgi:hypothetical protein
VYFKDLFGYFSSRTFRKVDMSSVVLMKSLDLRVDTSSCPLQDDHDLPDPMIVFFQFVPDFMLKLGGTIPHIVQNKLSEAWVKELKDASRTEMDFSVLEILEGIPIYLLGEDQPGYIPKSSTVTEGNSSWSLSAEEFVEGKEKPNIENAQLFIYISGLSSVDSLNVSDIIQKKRRICSECAGPNSDVCPRAGSCNTIAPNGHRIGPES